MTSEVLEKLHFYLEHKALQDRVAASNCHLNGYHKVALQHENEAAMAEKILNDLDNERGKEDAGQETNN
jgi:hypothetical protein